MKIILEELDGPYYLDVIFSPDEIDKIKYGEMVCAEIKSRGRIFYIAAIIQGTFEYDEETEE